MNHLPRLQDLLPAPYTDAGDSVLGGLLDVIALELEIFDEDLDRMRQSHWIRQAYRLGDAEKLAALVGVEPLPWEDLRSFRERLLALVKARLRGAIGPGEIREFVYSYLRGAERVTGALLVPGLQSVPLEGAFLPPPPAAGEPPLPPARPLFRRLALVENPERRRQSAALAARGGRVPYLFRWEDTNRGLAEADVELHVSGMPGGRTVVPILVNLTTGDLIGYADRLAFGQTLTVRVSPAATAEKPRLATASIDGRDVTATLFGLGGFVLGRPFAPADLDAEPNMPRLTRGVNEWIFLSVGIFDLRGLNGFFFAMADADLREAVFDTTSFDHALFPSGTVATIALEWTEVEPASFEVHVPRHMTRETASPDGTHLSDRVVDALRLAIADLHAAGVHADVRLRPFAESQPQRVRVRLSWIRLDPERGPSGTSDGVTLGGRFGESRLGGTRFE